ncbi:MAG TPA: hypothetical protein OIM39_02995 [Bacteroidaceae bacterium]|nr:hypothetical protein [Bacteroidaceae bacterium]
MSKGIYKYIIWQIVFIFFTTELSAQSGITALLANVTRTSHNELIAKDVVTSGRFYFQYPDKICMIFSENKDMMLMNGSTYIMMENGKRNMAKGKMQELFGMLQKVLQAVVCQTSLPEMTEKSTIQVIQEGETIRIIPVLDAKAKRRIPFTSFVITCDTHNHKLKTLRMNGKGENYVLYALSDYVANSSFSTEVFNVN